jgi:hypothetical protein
MDSVSVYSEESGYVLSYIEDFSNIQYLCYALGSQRNVFLQNFNATILKTCTLFFNC